MTPAQVEEMARERYNAVGETFFSQAEVFRMIYSACQELATETECIERVFTTTTVNGTQEYAWPTNIISVHRVTYDGNKLKPIDMRQGDQIQLNQALTVTGQPQYYAQFNETFILYPAPNDAKALKVWGSVEAQEISATTSTLDVPTWTHTRLVDFVLKCMHEKDKDYPSAERHLARWEMSKIQIKRWMRRRLRGDGPAIVKTEESQIMAVLGAV